MNNVKQINDIKAKAVADGTFMKAPNGNPTNLTERQWLQVRTKAFKNWFGDWKELFNYVKEHPGIDDEILRYKKYNLEEGLKYSKLECNTSIVVDENGEPKVVHHFTTHRNIRVFDEKRTPYGFWFTTNENPENIHYPNDPPKDAIDYPAFLNIRKGYVNNQTKPSFAGFDENGRQIYVGSKIPVSIKDIKQIKEWGQSILQEWDKETFYAVFNSDQIKFSY